MSTIRFRTIVDLNPKLGVMENFATPREWLGEAVRTNLRALSTSEWDECPFPKIRLTKGSNDMLMWAIEVFGRDQIILSIRNDLFVSSMDQMVALKLRFPEFFVEV